MIMKTSIYASEGCWNQESCRSFVWDNFSNLRYYSSAWKRGHEESEIWPVRITNFWFKSWHWNLDI